MASSLPGRWRSSTVPAVPSTRTRSPVFNRIVASPQPTTAGIPSRGPRSRRATAEHPVGNPAARGNSGVQPTFVTAVTSTSPIESRSAGGRPAPVRAPRRCRRSRGSRRSPCRPWARAALATSLAPGRRARNGRCGGWGRPPSDRGRRVRGSGPDTSAGNSRPGRRSAGHLSAGDMSLPRRARMISGPSRKKMSSPSAVNSPALSANARSTQK